MAEERVELTDLDVIARYSLAVRSASADRQELIDTLRADLAWLEGGGPAAVEDEAAPPTGAPRKSTAARKAPAKRAAAAGTRSRRSSAR